MPQKCENNFEAFLCIKIKVLFFKLFRFSQIIINVDL